MSHNLVKSLSTPDNGNLISVCMSLDDFYKTHSEQLELATRHSQNPLLRKRGNPGTHDLQLMQSTLNQIMDVQKKLLSSNDINTNIAVPIPRYNKALFLGEGDRVANEEWPKIILPVDIILIEGWCLGFQSIEVNELEDIISLHPMLQKYSLNQLNEIQKQLQHYERVIYPYANCMIQIRALDIDYVKKWRLEQEHDLKKLGQGGMTDEQVQAFISNFYPLYIINLASKHPDSIISKLPCLKITLNENREIVQ